MSGKVLAFKGRPSRSPALTVPDCSLDGRPVELSRWQALSSGELARIVGLQEPGGQLEDARDYDWEYTVLPVTELECCNEDGEAPEGGWEAAHRRHLASDAEAVMAGSQEYAGRDKWLRDVWGRTTAIHPLFVVLEDGHYRLWDGYRRLAGAFAHGVADVAVLLGTPKMSGR